jgi:hypothetical protein
LQLGQLLAVGKSDCFAAVAVLAARSSNDRSVPLCRHPHREEFWHRKTRTDYPQAWWLWIAAPPTRTSLADENGDEIEDRDRVLALA